MLGSPTLRELSPTKRGLWTASIRTATAPHSPAWLPKVSASPAPAHPSSGSSWTA